MHISDIEVFRKIFSSEGDLICILDANSNAEKYALTHHPVFKNNHLLSDFLKSNPKGKYLIVNITAVDFESFFSFTNVVGVLSWLKCNRYETTMRFINNRDKTMRWIFPAENKYPSFLNLYNGSGWKANLFQMGVKMAYSLGFRKIVSQGECYYYSNQLGKKLPLVADTEYDQYSIFTGTVGENRKIIVELTNDKKTSHFVKVPLTESSKELVNNEFKQLKSLKNIDWKNLVVPTAKQLSKGIQLSNVKPVNGSNHIQLTKIHIDGLLEMYQNTQQQSSLEKLEFFQQSVENINALEKISIIENGLDKEKINDLVAKLKKLVNHTNSYSSIPVALAHGDFTPWNMYLSGAQLHVYDWEMAKSDMPIFYDGIHFIFQTNILIQRSSYKVIKQQLNDFISSPNVKTYINQNEIDFKLQYRCYLLYTVSYYLKKYVTQPHLHEQVHWLINTWIEAINDIDILNNSNIEPSHSLNELQ